MLSHLRYFWYVMRHKYFVALECFNEGLSLKTAFLHDWDKLLPVEWFPYVHRFYGKKNNGSVQDESLYKNALWLHLRRNKHHWQHWLLIDVPFSRSVKSGEDYCSCLHEDSNYYLRLNQTRILVWDSTKAECLSCGKPFPVEALLPLDMDRAAMTEMLADWRGASRAHSGKDQTWTWYEDNHFKMLLSRRTREWIEERLGVYHGKHV